MQNKNQNEVVQERSIRSRYNEPQTCNYCAHHLVCKYQYALGCSDFMSKNHNIEVPFLLGEKVYIITHGTIEKSEVKGFFFGAAGQTLEVAVSTEPEHAAVINESFVYHTCAEAEQAWKERESE
jgi:hypothetical protein